MAKSATRKTKGKTPGFGRGVTMAASLAHALALSRAGRFADALVEFDRAIDRFGPAIELLYNRGVMFQELGHHQEALLTFSQITDNTTRSAVVHFGIGVSHQKLGDTRKAVRAYDRAIELAPTYAEAYNNRGIVLQTLGRWYEAIADHRAAIDAEPTFADALNSLGAALHENRQDQEALDALDKAIALQPNHREALSNRAICLQALGRYDEAFAAYERAIDVPLPPGATFLDEPGYAAARFNRSLLSLLHGDFETGWQDYEYRSLSANGQSAPLNAFGAWDGTPQPNGIVYVRTEQGIGDTIHFLRYMPLVKERCAKVYLECPRSLAGLAAFAPGVDAVIVKPEDGKMLPAPEGSVEVYMLSLPAIFKTTVDSIPSSTEPYLKELFDYRCIWRPRIEESPERTDSLRVGIVWAGAASHRNDAARSCRFTDFAPIIDIPGVQIYSLQKGPAATQLFQSWKGGKVIDLQYGLLDYCDTASAIQMMDMVITVDTSVAHLAGALGKTVWTLLPTNPDWRWLLDRDDSPWYSSMRLFRQKTAGDWSEVMDRVTEALIAQTKPVEKALAA